MRANSGGSRALRSHKYVVAPEAILEHGLRLADTQTVCRVKDGAKENSAEGKRNLQQAKLPH